MYKIIFSNGATISVRINVILENFFNFGIVNQGFFSTFFKIRVNELMTVIRSEQKKNEVTCNSN